MYLRSLAVEMIVVDKRIHFSPQKRALKEHLHKWKNLLNKHMNTLNSFTQKDANKLFPKHANMFTKRLFQMFFRINSLKTRNKMLGPLLFTE